MHAFNTSPHVPMRRQRGFSLFIVLVMLLLSVLLVVGGARVANLMESMAGNQQDSQRAFEAAEAALLDAQRDILGLKFNSATQSYVACGTATPCRASSASVRQFPDADNNGAGGYTVDSCTDGICYFLDYSGVATSQAFKFWTKTAYKGMTNSTTYGTYTGAPTSGPSGASVALQGARYWVEVINRSGKNPWLYRITAIATGARSNTVAQVQMNFDPDPVILPP